MGQEHEVRPPARGWVGPVVTFVTLQAGIVVGVWWVLL
jgi:hypothetical protein